MNPLRWLRNALRRKNDLQDELESHLRMATAARVAQGDTAEHARTEALREFGNVPLIADVTRERALEKSAVSNRGEQRPPAPLVPQGQEASFVSSAHSRSPHRRCRRPVSLWAASDGRRPYTQPRLRR